MNARMSLAVLALLGLIVACKKDSGDDAKKKGGSVCGDYDECVKACKKDNAACLEAGKLALKGKGTPRSSVKAKDHFVTGCEKGSLKSCAEACYQEALNASSAAPKCLRALRWCKDACDGGEASGCGYLGYMYQQGCGEAVAKDEAKSAKLLAQACKDGHGSACWYQAKATTDETDAFKLRKKGCSLGDHFCCVDAAEAYAEGKGVDKDEAKAVEHYDKGCDLEYYAPCARLGEAHRDGKLGLKKSASKAAGYFQRACDYEEVMKSNCDEAKKLKKDE